MNFLEHSSPLSRGYSDLICRATTGVAPRGRYPPRIANSDRENRTPRYLPVRRSEKSSAREDTFWIGYTRLVVFMFVIAILALAALSGSG